MFGFNFAPTGWAFCNGQLLPISQNTALFSLLGTTYGGDGKSTFALPDLQGNAPMQWGQGNGLSQRFLGEMSGSQTVTLLTSEMPVHTHVMKCTTENGEAGSFTQGTALAGSVGGKLYQANTSANLAPMNFQALSVQGSSLPHNNMQPTLVVNFCIAMQGVFPARP
ncbi:tail Collar domain-containing protein [Brevifollis gellanilyticus]|uniref:Tail Collar domain-containing protein n=2 Tax=Brevifollis gellanilyticus TaxID=748831 RepID=A0A512M7E2_9BACT|nr:tail Collar domain-containing protein [Brevifollis gellanilyticus]